jgi:hypothetical protein
MIAAQRKIIVRIRRNNKLSQTICAESRIAPGRNPGRIAADCEQRKI